MAKSSAQFRAWLVVSALCGATPSSAATIPDFYWNPGLLPGEVSTGPYAFGYVPAGDEASAIIGIEGVGPYALEYDCPALSETGLGCIEEGSVSVTSIQDFARPGDENFAVSDLECDGGEDCAAVSVMPNAELYTTLWASTFYVYNVYLRNEDGSLTYYYGNDYTVDLPFAAYSPIPVPPALPLLGTGLLAAFLIGRRRDSWPKTKIQTTKHGH